MESIPNQELPAFRSAINQRTRLVVINYAMNSYDPIFSHQFGIVKLLSPHYSHIEVLTNDYSGEPLSPNITTHTLKWRKSHNLSNAFHFLVAFIKILKTAKPDTIFCHMTEVQSLLIAPITRFCRIRHLLWYAHRSKSRYLMLNHLLVDGVITSTPGSCPISGPKVFSIGQSVSKIEFPFRPRTNYKKMEMSAVHIGRLDPAKGIKNIISLVTDKYNVNFFQSLTLVGDPTSHHERFGNEIKALASNANSPKIQVKNSLPRISLSKELACHDIFIHSSEGSLDKTLVEATFTGIPVITTNPEYLKHIGRWNKSVSRPSLRTELESYLNSTQNEIEQEIIRRYQIVTRDHSLESWIDRLVSILNGH